MLIKHALIAVKIVGKHAKLATSLKILQSILTAIFTPLSIFFTQQVINAIQVYVRGQSGLSSVMIPLGLLILSLFFLASNGLLDSFLNILLKRRVNEQLSPVIIRKFTRLAYPNFEDAEIANILVRMGDAPQEKILSIFSTTLDTMTLLLAIIGTSFIFVQVSIWFSLIFLALLVLILWLDFRAMRLMNQLFYSQSEEERKLAYLSQLVNTKSSLFELRFFQAAGYIMDKWRKLNKKVLDARVKMTIKSQGYYALSALVLIIWTSFVLFSLIFVFHRQSISLGLFMALIGSVSTVIGTSQSLSRSFTTLSQEYLEIQHYNKFLSLPEKTERINDSQDSFAAPHIIFENVHFSYPKTQVEILKGLSFEILSHQRVALVGENGAGKSTVIKLLCRLYEPTSGRITINGQNIADLSPEQLRKAVSVVFQDYACYFLTLRENVALGDIAKLTDDAAIYEALERGMVTEFVENLPQGLETTLGKIDEKGVDLSGGQWQRLAISRASLAESGMMILDEPSASLDPIAESEMYQAFLKAAKAQGCLIISHRLASAKLSEKIFVMKAGIIAEQGNHAELMEKNGLYAAMFIAQSSWYQGETVDE